MFWLFTILYLITTPCGYNFLWKATQDGQMFGTWQKVLDKVYEKGYKKLSMFLGGCEACFAHFISWLGYILYVWICWDIWPFGWVTIPWTLYMIVLAWWLSIYSKKLIER